MTSHREQIAQSPFVDTCLPPEIAPRPAAHNARPIDRCHVVGPLGRSADSGAYGDVLITRMGMQRFSATEAMEGTVLRVPCRPAEWFLAVLC